MIQYVRHSARDLRRLGVVLHNVELEFMHRASTYHRVTWGDWLPGLRAGPYTRIADTWRPIRRLHWRLTREAIHARLFGGRDDSV